MIGYNLYTCTHNEEIGFCTVLDGRPITTDSLQLSTWASN